MIDVTLFSDRARVTRHQRIHLVKGEQVIEFADLPDSIDDASVRASGRGDGVRIVGLEVRHVHRVRERSGDAAELRTELQGLLEKEELLTDAEEIEAARRSFLERVGESGGRNLTRGLAGGTTTIEALQSLSDFLATSLEASRGRSRETARKQRKIEKRIDSLRRRLEEYGIGERLELRRVMVTVHAEMDCDVELEVTYDIYGASWTPHYEVRLNDERLELHYLATIQQGTGEVWENAHLRLSTASPRPSMQLPQLEPWFVDRVQPRPPFAVESPIERSSPQFGGAAYAPAAALAPPLPYEHASVEAEGASVTYRIERPTTIPPDKTQIRVTIARLELLPTLDYLTVPGQDEHAFLRATVVNSTDFLLLPAVATLFHGSDYVGKTELDRIAPGEEFELQLGVDDRVKVDRRLISRRTSKAMIGSTKRVEFAYAISVANLLPRNAVVTLEDQLPVSRHESIKVKTGEMSPPPDDVDDMGIVTWTLELEPGREATITFSFAIEHPRDLEVDINR